MKRRLWEISAIILVSALLVGRQFSSPGFPSCLIEDAVLHMSWVRQFANLLAEGVWLPRWLPEANGGYGSPIFVFYSPLVYYVTALIYWLTNSIVLSMKIQRGIGLFLSGLSMLTYVRSLYGGRVALISALVYMSLPFHILDISFWTLYAETWAWIWFPLILLYLRNCLSETASCARTFCLLALCYAGLILTHLVSAYMFSLVIAGYIFFDFTYRHIDFLKRKRSNPKLENIGVTSCYINKIDDKRWSIYSRIQRSRIFHFLRGVPKGQIDLKGQHSILTDSILIMADSLKRELIYHRNVLSGLLIGVGLSAIYLLPAIYEQQFVHLEYSTMLPGFNFRNTFLFFPNLNLFASNPVLSQGNYFLQTIILLQASWSILSFIIIIQSIRRRHVVYREIFFLGMGNIISIYMLTSASSWIWDWVPGLPRIQFCTRWLSVLSFFSILPVSLAIGSYLEKSDDYRKYFKLVHFSVGTLAILATMIIIRGGCFLSDREEELAARSMMNAPEYNPQAMPKWRIKEIEPVDPPFQVIKGDAVVQILKWRGQDRLLQIDSIEESQIQIRLYDYPGWQLIVDGKASEKETHFSNGAMLVNLPRGSHKIQIMFVDTWWRRLALFVSIGTGLIWLFLFRDGKENSSGRFRNNKSFLFMNRKKCKREKEYNKKARQNLPG